MLRTCVHLSSFLHSFLLESLNDFDNPWVKIPKCDPCIRPRHACIGIPQELLPLLIEVQGIPWFVFIV